MNFQSDHRSGFTLVELMVVVAIIGILASVAISNYRKYAARSRQTEAKIDLSAVYTAEQSFFANEGTYTNCLRQIGATSNVDAAGVATSKAYYSTGLFEDAGGCGPNGGASCFGYKFTNAGATTLSCTNVIDTVKIMNSKQNPSLALLNDYASLNAYEGAHGAQVFWANAAGQGCYPNATYFLACAIGSISAENSGYDLWTIDSNKNLVNSVSGI